MVPHKEAIRIMIKAHLLLLVKATGDGSYGQIPGKFFEYLGARNRILCLGPKRSEVAELIHRLGAGYVIEDTEDTIDKMLNALREEYINYLNGKDCTMSAGLINEFSSLKMAREIASLLSN